MKSGNLILFAIADLGMH